jgi:hypothetical protein
MVVVKPASGLDSGIDLVAIGLSCLRLRKLIRKDINRRDVREYKVWPHLEDGGR